MKAVYLSTNGDNTIRLPNPLEVHGYGCAVIEITGKVTIPKRMQRGDKKPEIPQPLPKPPEETETIIPTHDELNDDPIPEPEPEPNPPSPHPAPRPPLNPNQNPTSQNLDTCIDMEEEGYTDNLYLCCNIIEESYVGEKKMPILRYLKRKNGNILNEITHPIWLQVIRPTISSIRLYIADETGKVLSLPRNSLNCTLLFIP